MSNSIHIIAGATASGKSARALALAQQRGGVIINADATQLYTDLRILSARPDEVEMQQAPHRLYGVLAGDDPASAARWLVLAQKEIEQAWRHSQLPIICGGTGLYLKALLEGLSPIPEVPTSCRAEAQGLLEEEGNAALHRRLAEVDPPLAERLEVGNSQRLVRGYAVWLASGKPLSYWQAKPKQPPYAQAKFTREIVQLPRERLYKRIDARFDAMMQKGALEEVQDLLKKAYDTSLPLMKAVGVPELTAHLQGELSREEAIALAKRNSRRYAKRQLTWLRHQFSVAKEYP